MTTERLRALCYSVGEECTQEVADLIDICMRTSVEERPSAKDVVARLQVLFAPMPDTVISLVPAGLHPRSKSAPGSGLC